MKNPLLAIIALVALAGILFAQGPPSSISAHSVVRQVELVGPIQVEGIVPLRDHLSIPFTGSWGSPFYWVCPAGMHARVTLAETWGCGTTLTYLTLASGEQAQFGSQSHGQNAVIHPGDTLTVEPGCGGNPSTGILQLAVEYD
jgi:hypothetical protein